jgi:acetyltransferase-like isoleucine patch superfamily enzyme
MALAVFSYLPSELKIFIYRCVGAKIGKNVDLGLGSYIIPFDYDFKKIHIENDVEIGDGVHILSKHLFLGERSIIKNNTQIWGQSDFKMGSDAYIDQYCFFDLRNDISIGNSAGIGGGSWLYTHGILHSILEGSPSKFGPIKIGDRSWIAANVFILPGISIGEDAIVESRSFVTRNVQSDSVVMGYPAREIAKTSNITRKLNFEDKTMIVRKILFDFIERNPETATLKYDEQNKIIFDFGKFTIIFIPRTNIDFYVNDFLKTYGNKIIILSFDIPEHIRTQLNSNCIPWFDFERNKQSTKKIKAALEISKFFGNFAIAMDAEY